MPWRQFCLVAHSVQRFGFSYPASGSALESAMT